MPMPAACCTSPMFSCMFWHKEMHDLLRYGNSTLCASCQPLQNSHAVMVLYYRESCKVWSQVMILVSTACFLSCATGKPNVSHPWAFLESMPKGIVFSFSFLSFYVALIEPCDMCCKTAVQANPRLCTHGRHQGTCDAATSSDLVY